MKKTLMGCSYEHLTIVETAPASLKQVPLYEPRPDLEQFEARVREHRRSAANSYMTVIPRSAIESLLRVDEANKANDDFAERRALALEAQLADAPVLPKSAPSPTMAELDAADCERRRQMRFDEMALVPVIRRRAA